MYPKSLYNPSSRCIQRVYIIRRLGVSKESKKREKLQILTRKVYYCVGVWCKQYTKGENRRVTHCQKKKFKNWHSLWKKVKIGNDKWFFFFWIFSFDLISCNFFFLRLNCHHLVYCRKFMSTIRKSNKNINIDPREKGWDRGFSKIILFLFVFKFLHIDLGKHKNVETTTCPFHIPDLTQLIPARWLVISRQYILLPRSSVWLSLLHLVIISPFYSSDFSIHLIFCPLTFFKFPAVLWE